MSTPKGSSLGTDNLEVCVTLKEESWPPLGELIKRTVYHCPVGSEQPLVPTWHLKCTVPNGRMGLLPLS